MVVLVLALGVRKHAADLDVDLVQRQRVGWFAHAGRLGVLVSSVSNDGACCFLNAGGFNMEDFDFLDTVLLYDWAGFWNMGWHDLSWHESCDGDREGSSTSGISSKDSDTGKGR